ncbi:hypothetical protein [Thalassotalea agarivorans]|uniref:Uncharacterized protein n=2 Tax=Thalassotalea agarivorans TaxID=349064 RepID=A0A1I0HFP4_THASX|nr:hypothetical protein [Thalassotalea agarivorans]SET82677.1 hypothetical protein SAMN05660429_02788 [Thalassotalea agarivorans]
MLAHALHVFEDELLIVNSEYSLTQASKEVSLLNYHQQYPTNQLAYLHLLKQCAINEPSYCSESFYRKADALFPNNGAPDFIRATIAAKNNNQAQFERLIESAAEKTAFDFKSFDYNDYFIHSYTSVNDIPIGYAALNSQGYVAAMAVPNPTHVIEQCEQAFDQNLSLHESCYILASTMSRSGGEMIVQAIGLKIEENYFQQTGKPGLDEVYAQKQQFEQSLDKMHQLNGMTLSLVDEQFVEGWLSRGLKGGELAAQAYAIEESKRLSLDQNYHPCL